METLEMEMRAVSRIAVMEEVANAITHGFGLLLSIVGLSWLLMVAQATADPWKIGSAALFGSSLILLYAASTFYHSFQAPHIKHRLRIFDHCAIYILIAGSYTPFALITLYDVPSGWWLFCTEWSLATIGIIFKLFFSVRWNLLSTLFYMAMGWLVMLTFAPLVAALPTAGLYLLITGGLFYTVGAIIYLIEKPLFHHAIWHLFVMGGSACHYFTVLYYVL